MLTFIKFDNAKKLAKVTKIRKSIIKTIDLMGVYDVGYDCCNYLVIATNADNIDMPHVAIKRLNWGKIVVHKCDNAKVVDTCFYGIDEQEKAVFSAMMFLERRLLA